MDKHIVYMIGESDHLKKKSPTSRLSHHINELTDEILSRGRKSPWF